MMRPLLGTLIPAILLTLLLTLTPVIKHPATAQPAKEPDKFALLVGINDYSGTGFGSLKYARSDMEKLKLVLGKAGFTVTLLANKDATRQGIEQAVAKIAAERKRGDIFLLALTGHGIQDRGPDGQDDAFFCPVDGLLPQPGTMIRLPRLVEGMGERGPNLVLVDACRDSSKKGFSGSSFVGKLPSKTSMVLSCSAGQSAWETNRMYQEQKGYDKNLTDGHGVFFYHVLEALNGKAADKEGKVTWSEVVKYLGRCNDTAKSLLPEYAERAAKYKDVPLPELDFQSPNEIKNTTVDFDPVLTRVATQAGPLTRRGERVRILLIADTTDPAIGALCQVGLKRMKAVMERQIDKADRGEILTLVPDPDGFSGKDVILDKIRSLGDLKNQSLVCYYLGHGAVDMNSEHYLELYGTRVQPPGTKIQRPLSRKDLLAAMRSTGARLRVLITDASTVGTANIPADQPKKCDELEDIGEIVVEQERGGEQDIGDIAAEKKPTLESLFLRYRGEVDINAATPPEDTWFMGDCYGGIFSYAFTDLAQRESVLTWTGAREYLVKETNREFGLLLRQAEEGNLVPRAVSNRVKAQKKQTPLIVLSTDLAPIPK